MAVRAFRNGMHCLVNNWPVLADYINFLILGKHLSLRPPDGHIITIILG